MWRVYYHFGRRAVISRIVRRWVGGRIKMGWLRDTFLERGNNSTEVERI
ncbi:hypothetical protein Godav_009977 [Gossypium davidsonii]|uniref:Uncharacterized protein n=1 Tax=Gossypium davidsonii TaxID=34287 RepID=A0A7J8SF19_GOSDV|nr:hypothetical protein [Gossypium davidsonii]